MNDRTKYWIELSDYDYETAEAMLKSKRFLYVGFMCHQTIEKAFKALFTSTKEENPPYSHNLTYLARKGDFYKYFSEIQKNFIDQLEPLNIEARYPVHKEKILKTLTESTCKDLLKNTKDLQQWIKSKL